MPIGNKRDKAFSMGYKGLRQVHATWTRQRKAPGAPAITSAEFAEALSRLVAEAEDAGLELEKILAEIEGIANMEVVVA